MLLFTCVACVLVCCGGLCVILWFVGGCVCVCPVVGFVCPVGVCVGLAGVVCVWWCSVVGCCVRFVKYDTQIYNF